MIADKTALRLERASLFLNRLFIKDTVVMMKIIPVCVFAAMCSLGSVAALAHDSDAHHTGGGTSQPDTGTNPGHGGPNAPTNGGAHGDTDNPSFPGHGHGGYDPDDYGGGIDDPSFPGGNGGGDDWGI